MMNSSRKNNLNIIRFIAALMVIWGHMEALLGVPSHTIFNMSVSTIGVKIFFIISGYLIYESYKRDSNILRYSIRRFTRIMPALIVMVLVTTFIVGALLSSIGERAYFKNSITYEYLWNILLNVRYGLPGVFENNVYPNAVNGSLWTLPVEMALYFILPLILVLTKRFKDGKVGIVVAFILLFILRIIKYEIYPDAVYVVYGTDILGALAIVPYFFIGCLFTFDKIKKLLNLQVATALIFVFACLNFSYTVSECILNFLLPYFVFSFAFEAKPVFARCFEKNDYSYGIYLYSFLIQQIVVQFLYEKVSWGVNRYALISTLISMICAIISWHFVEKPCNKVGKRIIKRLETKDISSAMKGMC